MQALYQHLCFHPKVEVLHALSGGVLAVCKPCGLLTHPNPSPAKPSSSNPTPTAPKNTLIQARYDHQKECYVSSADGTAHRTYLTHRLDKGTSGIMLLTTSQPTAGQLKKQFKLRQIQKEYYAIVHGTRVLQGKQEVWWEDPYAKEHLNDQIVRAKSQTTSSSLFSQHKNPTKHYSNNHTDIAITKAIIAQVNHDKKLTLLRLLPSTGFTHQLRFQCARHHCSIVGDDVYGDFTYNKVHKIKRMYLHAFSIQGQYNVGEEVVPFDCQAPLPTDFQALML